MQKIVPHLWFDTQASEAAQFYTDLFPDSAIRSVVTLRDTPSGDSVSVDFELAGYRFMAISAGPYFTINPSISFMLNFDPSRMDDAEQRLRTLWEGLSAGGEALMPLGAYPFSPLFGWIRDRFGVTWQLILTNPEGEDRPFIIPSLMFTGEVAGRAQEATDFYLSVFQPFGFEGAVFDGAAAPESRRGQLARRGPGQEPDPEGTTSFTDVMLAGQWFAAMDSAHEHGFGFNEAVSLLISCDSQEEIDYFWAEIVSRSAGRAVRLAEGRVRRLVADRPNPDGPDDGGGHARTDRPRHPGVPAHEEARHPSARGCLRNFGLSRPLVGQTPVTCGPNGPGTVGRSHQRGAGAQGQRPPRADVLGDPAGDRTAERR